MTESDEIERLAAQSIFDLVPKKGRGMAQRSLDLIGAMYDIAKACQPISGRGVGYKLFSKSLIPSMKRHDMARVYRLLRLAREHGEIPWPWVVDETRELERASSWDDPAEFVETVRRAYRRDFWHHQTVRPEVWSEKGTVRGVLAPVLDRYGVGFRVMHGFSGATSLHDIAQDEDNRRRLIPLYVGDHDPSGMFMSEVDIPTRLRKYGGGNIHMVRVAVHAKDALANGLPSFPASEKRKDPRYEWFVARHGHQCWELDAMDPNDLRQRVEACIKAVIEPEAWARCETVERAERESLRSVLDTWKEAKGAPA